MFYNFPLTIPSNTAKDDEIFQECIINYGVIKKIDILFPSGCCGFAYVRVHRNNTQILPTNDGQFFASDNEAITTNEHIEVLDRPFILTFSGYNLDDTYDHTIYLRIWLENDDDSLKQQLNSAITDIIKELNST